MKVRIRHYPNNFDSAFSINIDDLHPESRKNEENIDFGYEPNGLVWQSIKKIIDEMPYVKLTIFTVASWQDRNDYPDGIFWPLRLIYRKRRSYPKYKFRIDKPEFKNWIKMLNDINKSNNLEYSMHGLSHHNISKNYGHSMEFAGLNKKNIILKLDDMLDIFDKSGLRFTRGYRPPGWAMNKLLVDELIKRNFLYIAALSDFKTKIAKLSDNVDSNYHSIIKPNFINDKIVSFIANCFPHQFQRAVEISRMKGTVIAHLHIAKTQFGLVSIDKNFGANIKKMTDEIRNQTLNHIWFATLSEIAIFRYAMKYTEYKILSDSEVRISNKSKYPLDKLTVNINNTNYIVDHIRANSSLILNINKLKLEKLKVSVVLTVYNGQKNIIESLNSLCHQSYKNLEIIVVNDGSTDNTKQMIEEYLKVTQDCRLKVVNMENGGRSKARNAGLMKSSGSIVTFCEDDAVYDRDYIKYAIKHFEKGDRKLGGVIGPHYVKNKKESLNTRAKDVERRRNFINYRPNSCWFYRRQELINIGMFDEGLELVEDIVPAIKLKEKGCYFVFEDKCRWLHTEPANYFTYLRRKFRGGIGLALLQKKGLKKVVFPIKIQISALIFFICIILFGNSVLSYYFFFLFVLILFLLILRINDIIKVRKVTDEKIPFLILQIYIEYTWWFSTFVGFIYGLTLSTDKINKYLKGR